MVGRGSRGEGAVGGSEEEGARGDGEGGGGAGGKRGRNCLFHGSPRMLTHAPALTWSASNSPKIELICQMQSCLQEEQAETKGSQLQD